jgi:hypothetical protein
VAGSLLAALYRAYRRWQCSWGATDEEIARPLPGDDVVRRPQFTATNVVEIRAEPAQVWPWLVQMGAYTRAGWYSYDRFDNAGRPSAERIVPELQSLAVGDVMATSPSGEGFRVHEIIHERSLVLEIAERDGCLSSVFVLDRVGPGRTRLVHRIRWRFRLLSRRLPLAVAMDAGHFVMNRRMLLGIRRRAERLWADEALTPAQSA